MKYEGSCHCKSVQYYCEFELKEPTYCSCSYCYMRNAPLHVVDDLTVTAGKKSLSTYRFNKMKGIHHFCKNCGIFIYCTPPEPVFPFAISLTTLKNCDWSKLPVNFFNGKDL